MNPWTWLEQHPNAALAAIWAGSIALVGFAAWFIHWYVIAARYWLDWIPRRRADRRADLEWERVTAISDDEWQKMADAYDEWEPEPYTDADADRLIADLTIDLPGPAWATRTSPDQAALGGSWAGELHERLPLVDALTDDPDLLQWDIDCQVARIREIRGELAALKEALCAA